MGQAVDSVTLMGKAHKQIPAGRKEKLKPVFIKALKHVVTGKLENIFLERIWWKASEAKEFFKTSNSPVSNPTTKFQKVSYQSGSKRSFGYINTSAGVKFSDLYSLNIQDRKKKHQHQRQSSSSTRYITTAKVLRKRTSVVSIFLEFLSQYK